MCRGGMDEERIESHESPEVLCHRVKAGDQDSFGLLVRLYEKKVFQLALSIVRDREEALDVVQETFMKLYQNMASFEEGRNFTGWLFRIAKNVAIDHYRRSQCQGRSREKELPMSSVEPWLAAPSTNSQNTEMKKIMEKALDDLTEKQRLVFILQHWQGFSYEEIADILGVAVGTVKSLHFKSWQRMKSLLRQYLEGGREP